MTLISRFLRSTALEMQLDNEVTSDGVIAPRFIDEIADEVDIIEDKKASPFRELIFWSKQSSLLFSTYTFRQSFIEILIRRNYFSTKSTV